MQRAHAEPTKTVHRISPTAHRMSMAVDLLESAAHIVSDGLAQKHVCCTLTVSCFFTPFLDFFCFFCLFVLARIGLFRFGGQLPTCQQRLVVAIPQDKNKPSTQPKFNRDLLLCSKLPTRKSTNRQEKARKGKKRQRKEEKGRKRVKQEPEQAMTGGTHESLCSTAMMCCAYPLLLSVSPMQSMNRNMNSKVSVSDT